VKVSSKTVRLVFVAALVMLASAQAWAQPKLVLNGLPVPGLSTELVPGTAYVPAEPYARALGAEYRFGAPAGVVLLFGGRLLTLQSFGTPAQAAAATTPLLVDGRVWPGFGAVQLGGKVYLPVKSVTAALGGRTAYLAAQRVVAVVFPRPQLLNAEPPAVWGSFERFVLTFSAPVGLEYRFEPSLNVVRFRFPRAELGEATAEGLSSSRFRPGSRFSAVALVPMGGFIDFSLTLRPGNSYSFFSEPFGVGERVVIDVFRSRPDDRRGDVRAPVIVATPGTAGLARNLQTALAAKGIRTELRAAEAGFGAPALLSLRRAPLAAGLFNVYYLEDADLPGLDAPVRFASATAPGILSDAARARVTGLVPEYGRGERLAGELAAGLERRTTLRLGTLMAAPLRELSAAAGRGVLLELNPNDLNISLAEPLAAVLAPLLAPLGGR